MKYEEIGAIGIVLVLVITGAATLYMSDYRNILSQNQDDDLILLTGLEGRIELLGRSKHRQDVEFFRWKYEGDKIKYYYGHDLVDTSYWQVFVGSTGVWYNEKKPIRAYWDSGHVGVIFNITYFHDPYHTNPAGRLVREVEVYPDLNKETIKWIPYDSERYNFKWIHETDCELESQIDLDKKHPNGTYYNCKGVRIDWSDSAGMVSAARAYQNGKAVVRYESDYGKRFIDPEIGTYKKKNYMKHLGTHVGLTHANSSYLICNPTGSALKDMLMSYRGDREYIRDIEVMEKVKYNVTRTITRTTDKQKCVEVNKTKACYNETREIKFNETKVKYAPLWRDSIMKFNFELSARKAPEEPTCKTIMVRGRLKPKLGERSIDHIPTFAGYEYREFTWWNSSWNKKKPINLSVASGTTEENHTVRLNISYDADMQADFSDIRFTNGTESTELYYFIEEKKDSEWAYVWLNMNDTNITTVNRTLAYMYYGNPSASSASEIDNFGDDFNSVRFEQQDNSNVMIQPDKGYMEMNDTEDYNHSYRTSVMGDLVNQTVNGSWELTLHWEDVSGDSNGELNLFGFWNDTGFDSAQQTDYIGIYRYQNKINIDVYEDGSGETLVQYISPGAGTEIAATIWKDGRTMYGNISYVNGTVITSNRTGKNVTNSWADNVAYFGGITRLGAPTPQNHDDKVWNYTLIPFYEPEIMYSIGSEELNIERIFLNGSLINISVEERTQINITGTSTHGQICLSSSHPDLGENFTCGNQYVEKLWKSGCGIMKFNDSNKEKNLTFSGAGWNSTYFFEMNNRSAVTRSLISLLGYKSGTYPKDVKIDVGGDGTNDTVLSGTLIRNQTYLYYFNDSSIRVNNRFTNRSNTFVSYIDMPKDINVTTAVLNLTPEVNDYVPTYSYVPDTNATMTATTIIGNLWNVTGRENEIWMFGGYNINLDNDPCNTTFYWTSESNLIKQSSDVPYEPGYGPMVEYAEIGGTSGFLVCGGYSQCNGSHPFQKKCYYRQVVGGNSWVVKSDMPTYMEHMGWVSGGKIYGDEPGTVFGDSDIIYVFGGSNSTSDSNDNCWKYNKTDDSWSVCTNMPRGRGDMVCEWWNTTHIACYSGWAFDPAATSGSRYLELYDSENDRWTEYDMGAGSPEYCYGAGGFRFNGTLYRVGGYYSDYYKDVYIVDDDLLGYTKVESDWEDDKYLHGNCVEFGGTAECFSTGGAFGWKHFLFYPYPDDVTVKVGSEVNTSFSISGGLISENKTSDFAGAINDYIVGCSEDEQGYCQVPIYLWNSGGGNITLHDLDVNTTISNINLGMDNISCASEYCDTIIKVWSSQAGIVELSNVNITYNGTCKINFTVVSDPEINNNVTVYWSNFSIDVPDEVFFVAFIPENTTEYNVTPYGQSDTIPAYNITALNWDRNMSLYMRLNGSHDSCWNMTASNTTNKTDGFEINTTWQKIAHNIEYVDVFGIRFFLDIVECASTWINVWPEFKSCCKECSGCP